MWKQLSNAAFVIAALAAAAAHVHAQDLNMNLSDLARWNMEQDQMAMQRAAQFSQDWYQARQAWRRQTGYYGYLPGPVTTADLVRSNAELRATYDRTNAAWHDRSARTTAAIEGYSTGAIRGQGTYYHPQTGEQVLLPWTHDTYQQTPYGQFAPGADPHYYNPTFYPYYGP